MNDGLRPTLTLVTNSNRPINGAGTSMIPRVKPTTERCKILPCPLQPQEEFSVPGKTCSTGRVSERVYLPEVRVLGLVK
jgi:hypothetical protein